MNKLNKEHIKAAISWQVYFADGTVCADEHVEFQAWLTANPEHKSAWEQVNQLHRRLQDIPLNTLSEPLQEVSQLRQEQDIALSSRKYLHLKAKKYKGLLSVLLLGGGLLLSTPQDWRNWAFADYRTAIGKTQEIVLTDGSKITLNSGSAVSIQYNTTERLIILEKGEVLAHVAADATRPFIMRTDLVRAEALGTIYSLSKSNKKEHNVLVVESQVHACSKGLENAQSCQQLVANQQVKISAQGWQDIETIDAQAATSWVNRMLTADNMPLSELLAALQKNNYIWLKYDNEQMDQYFVSGVYSLDNPVQTLQAIQKIAPISFTSYNDKIIVIK